MAGDKLDEHFVSNGVEAKQRRRDTTRSIDELVGRKNRIVDTSSWLARRGAEADGVS